MTKSKRPFMSFFKIQNLRVLKIGENVILDLKQRKKLESYKFV